MIGSWAGAMGHTQWMPEVWLHMGVDYDHDGRISPFGRPDDALAGTARYLVERGKYRRGEAWGCEVQLPAGFKHRTHAGAATPSGASSASCAPTAAVRATATTSCGCACRSTAARRSCTGQNFSAVMSYNPAFSYALAIVHLADRIAGDGPFVQPFPGGERPPTLAEVQEIQRRLTALGFDTGGTDGRVGLDTLRAARGYEHKVGMEPADGYPGSGCWRGCGRAREAGRASAASRSHDPMNADDAGDSATTPGRRLHLTLQDMMSHISDRRWY